MFRCWFLLFLSLLFIESGFCGVVHDAIREGRSNNEIKKLIREEIAKNELNVNKADDQGKTLMDLALEMRKKDVFKYLVSIGADFTDSGVDGKPSHLSIMIENWGVGLIWNVLRKKQLDVKGICVGDGESLLHKAIEEGNENIIDLLLGKGVEVNVTNFNGQTPLHSAAEEDDDKSIDKLLKNGASTSVSDNDGATPLQTACSNGNLKAFKKLLTSQKEPPSLAVIQHIAREANSENDVRLKMLDDLVKYFDINSVDHRGQSALHLAVKCRNFYAVKKILEIGANVNLNP